MKILCLVPLIALAACGGETQNKAKAADAALQPGQYEVSSEVTQFRKADEGQPKINTPIGTRTTRSVCLADATAPSPEPFADEAFVCQTTGSPYVRSGTLNLSLRCTRPDLRGDITYSVSGSFDSQSFQADRQLTTTLSGDGDVVVASRIQGRRTGDCTPSAAGAPTTGNASSGAAKTK
jgi:hypothetical protein